MKIAALATLDLTNHILDAISYVQYRSLFEEAIMALKEGRPVNIPHSEVLPLNWQRSTRIEKTFQLEEGLRSQLESLDKKLTWLIITEPWCGDSAQSLPAIAKIAEASHGMIELRIVLRDQNIELMDAFLTNGKRGIPKLIQLDENGHAINTWGPRPKESQELIDRLKQDPDFTEIYKEELHKWYAHDHCISIQKELSAILPVT